MKRDEIIEWFKKLAASQGLYCRLLQAISDMNNNDREALFEHLEAQNFTGPVDLIIYIEG